MSDFFKFFPKLDYTVDTLSGRKITFVDIFQKIKFNEFVKSDQYFETYIISDYERPDTIAVDFYGNSEYDWIILKLNKIYDIYEQWPKPIDVLEKIIIKKYGSLDSSKNLVHHYENNNGSNIDFQSYKQYGGKVFSCYDYEIFINDKKRKIILFNANLVEKIQSDFRKIFE